MTAIALPPVAPVLLQTPYQHPDWILEQLTPGGRLVVLSKGHISLTECVAAAVKITGPARATIAVWGICRDDVVLLHSLVERGLLTSVRMVVPYTEGTSTADYDWLRSLFGVDNIIHSATHAKLAAIENDRWHVAIRGSLNMYACGHLEQLDVDDSPEICATIDAYARAPQTRAAYPKPLEEMAHARADVAGLVPGGRLFGVTQGYSLLALVRAALEITGPARVSVVTARIGKKEAAELATLAPGARVIVGQSVAALAKKDMRTAAQAIGHERIRVAMVHAKLVTIRNDQRNLTIRSSMNLCANLRAEQFDLSDDPAVADQADAWIDYIFRVTPAGIATGQPVMSAAYRNSLRHLEHEAPPAPEAIGAAPPVKPLELRPGLYEPLTLAPITVDPLPLDFAPAQPLAL